jgi:BMFP domain-containing protein YqiC
MIAKKPAGGSAARATATTKKARVAAKKPAAGLRKPAAKITTAKRAASAERVPQAAPAPSPDFSSVMKTLERVRSKNDALEERISRLLASLA